MEIAEADGATGATGIDRLHPVFPGQARVWEMIRSFWPFTRGRRRILIAQISLSLVLFGATALVPLQVGHLLTAALSSANADKVAARYVVDPIELQRATQAVLAPELETPAERRTAGVGIRAAMDQLRVTEAEATLDALFPSNMAYRTDAFTSIDDPSPGWEQEADALIEAPRIRRDDLEAMRDRALANPSYATNRAFNWVVSLLLTDPDAKSQRSQWRNENFRTELFRFAGLLLSIFVLRAVTLLLAQRATLFGARRLQDAVFERVHSTALVDAGALARPSMVSRCGAYVDRVTNTLLKAQTEGIPSLAALLFSSAVLLYIDVPIGLIMIGVIVAFEAVRRLISTRWSRLAHERLDLNTALSEVVDGSIAGSGGVRAARAEADERRRFAVKADEVMRHTRRLENMAEAFRLTAFGFGQIAVLVVIAVVGFVRKDLNLAEATAVVLYVREVSASLQELPGMVVDMQEAAPYMRRLRRVLAAPLRRTPSPQTLPAPVEVDEVRLDNITFRYPDESPGCTDVSLRAERGRWTMLVGLETSGVHTVAELMAGLEEPDSGSIRVGDTELCMLDESALAGLISVLPAQPAVLEATVAENIGWGNPLADRDAIARAASIAGLGAWLTAFPDGLDTVVGRARQHLPTEVRVRIAAARVIASSAPVVVIDDPTASVDREVAEELWAALRTQLDGRVVVGVTTRLDLLGDDDLVLAFHAGQVVEQGSRQDLLHSGGRFGTLWSRFVDGAEGIVELGNVPALAALDPEVLRNLTGRLVTERFEPGETVFAEGEPADRVFLVVDGVVDLFADGRRLSSVRAGNYFGDLDLANETVRTTSARARTPLVTKSLHRLAVSRGVAGVLHRPEEERVLYTWIARRGAATRAELDGLSSRIDVERALAGLLADGTLTTSTDESGATSYLLSRSRRQSTHRAGTSLLATLFPD